MQARAEASEAGEVGNLAPCGQARPAKSRASQDELPYRRTTSSGRETFEALGAQQGSKILGKIHEMSMTRQHMVRGGSVRARTWKVQDSIVCDPLVGKRCDGSASQTWNVVAAGFLG